jgi:hypothetical protein
MFHAKVADLTVSLIAPVHGYSVRCTICKMTSMRPESRIQTIPSFSTYTATAIKDLFPPPTITPLLRIHPTPHYATSLPTTNNFPSSGPVNFFLPATIQNTKLTNMIPPVAADV